MERLLALVDLGSTATRLVLARVEWTGTVTVLETTRVETRLAASESGWLRASAIDAVLDAVGPFADRARERGARVLAIATAAVRDAPNQARLTRAVEDRTGARVRLLTGSEEAELGAEAALAELCLPDGTVADLGGGSLQLALLARGEVERSSSLPLGAVRLTVRHLHGDPPPPPALASLRAEVRAQLAPSSLAFAGDGPLVVMGGSARAVARTVACGTRGAVDTHVRLADLSALRARVEAMNEDERRRLPGLPAHRVDVIVAGMIVLEELLRRSGREAMIVSGASVRDGVLRREATRLARAGASSAPARELSCAV